MLWFKLVVSSAALALASCGQSTRGKAETMVHPDRSGARIEYFVEQPDGSGPWPTVIFLHGSQPPQSRPGGKVYVDWGVLDRFAKKGYLAVSVSLPGYGGSSGPADFAGPFTQHAVEAVLAKLKAQYRAAPDRVLIEGVSLGAITGALVTVRDPHIAGLVLISGLYDFPSFFAHPKSVGARAVRLAITAQTGGADEALRTRSALPLASNIKAATLILNGANDDRTDPQQARDMAEAITAHGGRAQVHIYPDFGHEIPVKARDSEIDAFIDSTLNH